MLRALSALAGGGALAGLLPRHLLAAAQSGAAIDPVEESTRKMASVPLQTLPLRDNVHLLFGPGGNMVVLDGPDGKILVDSSFGRVAPEGQTDARRFQQRAAEDSDRHPLAF